MISLNKQTFRKFCLDIINSETPLTELVRHNSDASLVVVYCESAELNKLTKKYPTKEKLFDFLAKHKDEPYLHICLYEYKKRLLTIDGGKIEDVIFS